MPGASPASALGSRTEKGMIIGSMYPAMLSQDRRMVRWDGSTLSTSPAAEYFCELQEQAVHASNTASRMPDFINSLSAAHTCDDGSSGRDACLSVFEPETSGRERFVLLGKLADLNELVGTDARKRLRRVACRP